MPDSLSSAWQSEQCLTVSDCAQQCPAVPVPDYDWLCLNCRAAPGSADSTWTAWQCLTVPDTGWQCLNCWAAPGSADSARTAWQCLTVSEHLTAWRCLSTAWQRLTAWCCLSSAWQPEPDNLTLSKHYNTYNFALTAWNAWTMHSIWVDC